MTLPQMRIGDFSVSAIGLGCMPFSLTMTKIVPPREQSIATVHAALDAGITLLDTANVYAPTWDTIGHNEEIVAEALRTYTGPADVGVVMVATKGGSARGEGETWGRNASLDGLRAACEKSLAILGMPSIDLYQLHRHDPKMTYFEQAQSLAALRDAGLIRRAGLSNCTLAELNLALEVLGGPTDGGIVSVQNEFSPRYRNDVDVLDRCTELGIVFLPWSPLGGAVQAQEVGSRYAEFAQVAEEVSASAQEVVLAWLRGLSPVMLPIPGASRPATIASIVRSLSISLTAEQQARLTATVPESVSMFPDNGPRSALR